jgi:hypothetical protein
MRYKIPIKKSKEKKLINKNIYFVDGKDVSRLPIYYLEDPDGNGLTENQTNMLWQYGVDTGIVWHLQGWYGRNAQMLLDEGIIHYPIKHKQMNPEFSSQTDYYGNPIPTHKEADDGIITFFGNIKRKRDRKTF